jgi:hypothetical protein
MARRAASSGAAPFQQGVRGRATALCERRRGPIYEAAGPGRWTRPGSQKGRTRWGGGAVAQLHAVPLPLPPSVLAQHRQPKGSFPKAVSESRDIPSPSHPPRHYGSPSLLSVTHHTRQQPYATGLSGQEA